MLSAILTRVSGCTLHEYLRPRLFEPLGIRGETWDLGPDGINPGGNGLTCKTVDILKLGILHAERGLWNGRRLLSQDWVDDATRAHSCGGYGYHWWAGPDRSFCAMGVFGQMLVVFPQQRATLALTAAVNGKQACSHRILPVLHRYLPAAFADAPLEPREEEAAVRRLAREVTAPAALASSAVPARRTGSLEYLIEPNALEISSLRLALREDRCTLELIDAQGGHGIEMGIGRWLEGETNMPGRELHHGYDMRPARVVAGARWLDADTLEMSWIFVASAFRDTVVCRFDGDRISLERRVNVNSGTLRQAALLGTRSR